MGGVGIAKPVERLARSWTIHPVGIRDVLFSTPVQTGPDAHSGTDELSWAYIYCA